MITITLGISGENLMELYNDESIQKMANDHLAAVPILHENVAYYSAFKDSEFMGAFLVIRNSCIDYEIHLLLLPKSVKIYRLITIEMLKILFNEVDRVSTVIIEGRETIANLAKKVGARHEGTKRKCFELNGVKKDAYLYGLLKSEFKG